MISNTPAQLTGMKVLSLTQPWATLVALGQKHIETRSWHTLYRGPLAIHASAYYPRWAREQAKAHPFIDVLHQTALPLGAIVATVELVECLPIVTRLLSDKPCVALDEEGKARAWHPMELGGMHGHYSDLTTEYETEFGDYTPGRWAWVFDLESITPLETIIPVKGSFGLWTYRP